jgi:alkaline phosphatase D
MEGRDYRTPDWTEKRTPAPTLWGREQIKWLGETLAASTATFRVILTTVPVVGPDRSNKDDNYANAGFAVEGNEIRELLARYPNLTVITGDRHWQYVSVDPATSVNEWSIGPSTAAHAGGWEEKTPRPEHRFLRTGQGGFLSGVVTPTATGARLELRLHDVDGRVVYREQK